MNVNLKRLLSFLVVMALVLGMVPAIGIPAVTAKAEETKPTYADDLSLDAENKAWCPGCGDTVTWEAATGGQITGDGKHVYLKGDLTHGTDTDQSVAVYSGKKICLHLNGHTYKAKTIYATGTVNVYSGDGGKVQFLDGVATGVQTGNNSAVINLYGGTYSFANAETAGNILSAGTKDGSGTINLYDAVAIGNFAMFYGTAQIYLYGTSGLNGTCTWNGIEHGLIGLKEGWTGKLVTDTTTITRVITSPADAALQGTVKDTNGNYYEKAGANDGTFTMDPSKTEYDLSLNGAQTGHTYTAYRIFKGDLSGNTLSNIVWGSGVTSEGQAALGNAAAKAEGLKTTADAEALAADVAPYLGTAAGSVTIAEGATSGTITGLEAGYYLVKTTATSATNDVYTYYIMKVVKDTDATIKADVPTVEKAVNDNDANIGDTVEFTLTATMPTNLQGYEKYKVIFHDTLSNGLDFVEGSVKVTVGSNDKTTAFTVSEKDGVLTISCDDVLAQGANASSKIIATYNAILDSDAIIGTDGNLNEVYLEYSNDPNWNGEGTEPTGETPKDDVKVYTWEIPVFKYTGTNTPLAGAGFTLYKGETVINLVDAGNSIYKVCTLTNCEHTHVTEIITTATGRFEIEGLEKGTYVLKETTVPNGYNKCDDVTVTIGENGALTQNSTATTEVGILNQEGSTLPETGGMGTTMFYIFGAILMLGAAVLLVTKRRISNAE